MASDARRSFLLVVVAGIACSTEVVDFRTHDAAVGDVEADSDAALDNVSIAEVPDSPGGLLDRAERETSGEPVQLPDGISATMGGTSRYVQYSCCESDRVSGCTDDVAGSATACKGTTFWKAYADDACRKQGLRLVDVAFYGDCTNPSSDGGTSAPCITLENMDSRCTICDDGTDSVAFYCESLVCKPLNDAGVGCQACVWVDHPDAPCTYCSDSAGTVLKDSCHTLIQSS